MPPAAPPIPAEFADAVATYARVWWDNTEAQPEAAASPEFSPRERAELVRLLREHRSRWARELEQVPYQFVRAWRAGRRLPIGNVLKKFCGPDESSKRLRLFRELLVREITLRFRAAEHPQATEYRARFPDPDFQRAIQEAFEHVIPAFGWRFRVVTDEEGEERVLSRGGQAVVLLGYDDQLDREVAIKRIEGGEDSVKRLRREAMTLARLADAGVPVVYGVGNDESRRLCLAEHLIRGPEDRSRPGEITPATRLTERIVEFHARRGAATRRNPAFLDLVAKLIGVCRTVAAAHTHDFVILHRDLKPDNLLLDANDQPFVIDWGLAAWQNEDAVRAACDQPVADEMTSVSGGGGTPGHLSPEQARNEDVTPAADVFGLGACLFQLVTGYRVYDCVNPWWLLRRTWVRPVRGSDPNAVKRLMARARGYRRAPHPRAVHPGADRELCDIARKAIDPEPRRRFRNADELAKALEDWLRDNRPRYPSGPRLRRWRYGFGRMVRHNTGKFSLGVLLLGAAVAGAAGTYWFSWYQRDQARLQEQKRSAQAEADRLENERLTKEAERVAQVRAEFEALKEVLGVIGDAIPASPQPDLRDRFLRTAKDRFRAFLELTKGDTRFVAERAEARFEMARAYRGSGDPDAARQVLTDGLAELKGAEHAPTVREWEAEFYWQRGAIERDLNKFDHAEKDYGAAEGLWRALQVEYPPGADRDRADARLARVLGYRGDLYVERAKRASADDQAAILRQATDDYDESHRLRTALYERDRSNAVAVEELAHAENNMGRLIMSRRRLNLLADPFASLTDAVSRHQKAIRLLNEVARLRTPPEPAAATVDQMARLASTRAILGRTHIELGDAYLELKLLREAEAEYAAAVALFTALRAANPQIEYRVGLAKALASRARVLAHAAADPDEWDRPLEEAQTILDGLKQQDIDAAVYRDLQHLVSDTRTMPRFPRRRS